MIDDFEHRVKRLIDRHDGEEGFPDMQTFGVSREQLNGYLFDKQAILDMKGTARQQYTVAGILIVLPVLVVSAIPGNSHFLDEWGLFIGIGVGLVLCLIEKLAMALARHIRLRRLADPKLEAYIGEVMKWE